MSELESRIQEVLNDPAQMAQIMQMAESFGFRAEEATSSSEDTMPKQDENNKSYALLRALIPCLPPEKQKRLQRAVKIGKISQLAGFAMSQGQETE